MPAPSAAPAPEEPSFSIGDEDQPQSTADDTAANVARPDAGAGAAGSGDPAETEAAAAAAGGGSEAEKKSEDWLLDELEKQLSPTSIDSGFSSGVEVDLDSLQIDDSWDDLDELKDMVADIEKGKAKPPSAA